ncbi:MAG: ParB N-terminal domain-containing protein [Lachnospiraceae bacterium]|nr:ParB N-terminal domain-containing protein [Lachnospiraceae bacterium]
MNEIIDKEELLTMEPKTIKKSIFRGTLKIEIHNLKNLIPFKNHPFTLYEGQRFTDMVESIRDNGVIVPIVVRPATEEGKYEILSGHNRVEAARIAGVDSVPAIVRTGLTEEEAMFIVTETNLMQRSFADLKHSERAVVLTTHYEAMKKKQGYRSDLIAEIEELSGAPMGHGVRTRDKIGEKYNLGKTTVARYLRINKLIPQLQERLDKGDIGMRVAEAVSFLKVENQNEIERELCKGRKINIKQASILKEESKNGELSKDSIIEIMNPTRTDLRIKPIKLSEQFLSKYFKPEQSTNEIEEIINKALENYFLSENS